MATSASGGPLVLPSYATNRIPSLAPTSRSNRSASFMCPLASSLPDCLVVEVGEPSVRVVGLLERLVGRAVVGRPERVLVVVRRAVQGLASAQLRHDVF